MASVTASLKRKGRLCNHRASHKSHVASQRRQEVSPSLPALKQETESSSNASTTSDETTPSSSEDSCSLSVSSSQESRSSDECISSSRDEKCGHTTAHARRTHSPSMESRSRPRRFKQTNQWDFCLGEHADERSHGKGQDAARHWSMEDFDVLYEIGNGTFGSILLAIEVDRNEHVALKEVVMKDAVEKRSVKYLRGEVEIQTSLYHKNILQSFGYFRTRDCITLVLEYARLGSLFEYKEDFIDGKLSLDHAARYMRQVTSAVAYLDSQQHVAHRDIKTENVVLTSESTAKLCDFGYAVCAPPDNDKRTTFCGTPEFIPPEMIVACSREREYVARYVDPWALGVLAYELVMGKSPFYLSHCEKNRIADAKGHTKTYHAIFDGIEEFSSLERPTDCDETFFDFCSALMQRNPRRRMSAAEALEHSWLCVNSTREQSLRRGRAETLSHCAGKRAKTQAPY